jgi:hypothetical protein
MKEVSMFSNPCITWGVGNSGALVLHTGGPCSSFREAVSETVPSAILRLALIQGGILTAIGLGVVGFLRSHSVLLVVGSMVLIFESVPLVFDGLSVFTLLAAVSFLWSAKYRLGTQSLKG